MANEKVEVNPAINGANLSPGRVKFMMVAIGFCMFVMGFSMFKLLPMQSAIMEFFQIQEGAYGILNTASGWVTVIFTIPVGFLIRKMSSKWCMFLWFVLLLGGSLIQVYTTNYTLFVIGRVIEGAGNGFLALLGHSLTANLVPRHRIGFWASFMVTLGMLGQVILTNAGTALMVGMGYTFQEVFLMIIALQAVALVVWMIAVPGSVRVTGTANSAKPTREQTLRVFKNKENWLVSVALIFFNIAIVSFSAYVIVYMGMRGIPIEQAAPLYSYTSLIGIFAMLAFGWLADKFGTKRKMAIFSFFTGIIALLLLVHVPINMIWIYIVFFGTMPRSVAGMSQACSPDIAEMPMDIPVVNSFRNTVSQLGNIVGGIITGFLLEGIGYTNTIYVLCVLMALGGICWIFAKKIP